VYTLFARTSKAKVETFCVLDGGLCGDDDFVFSAWGHHPGPGPQPSVGMLTLADLKRNGFIRCQSLNPIPLSHLDTRFDPFENEKVNDAQATAKEPTDYRFIQQLINARELAERFASWRDALPLACDILQYWNSYAAGGLLDQAEI
jgi:hypothetical protein